MKQRIIGLDPGTNSLGWAVVDRFDDGHYQLIRHGDLIFQEGVNIEKGIEKSRAAERTGYRSSRKHYFRRRLRKIETLKVLVKYGFCPQLTDEALELWQTKKVYPMIPSFLDWQKTDEATGKNPYYYRHKCLNEKLDLTKETDRFALGRAFYHLVQRRGFLSNRLDTSDDAKETGVVKTAISELSKEMEDAGFEFLGDYFYYLYSTYGNSVKIRNKYTDREEHYTKEFFAICKKQCLSAEQTEELRRALYFQRPLKSQKQNVGLCRFEHGKHRCIDSHPDYEEYRMLVFLNNIKVKGPNDIDLRPLTVSEREKVMPLFIRKSDFDFEVIAKKIAGKDNYSNIKDDDTKPYKFNYRMTQNVSACPTIALFHQIWGEDWKDSMCETYRLNVDKFGKLKSQQDVVGDVWNVLFSFSSQNKLYEFATNNLQLNKDDAEKFSKAKVSRGYTSLSLKAIRKILPFLRQGIIESHSVFLANVPTIVSASVWNNDEQRKFILENLMGIIHDYNQRNREPIENNIKDFLLNNFELKAGAIDKLYHPSVLETYRDATQNEDGVYQLGSPRTNSVRNPMAMRSLHQIRKVINELLKDGTIDKETEVHIEYARELNDYNKRTAIAIYDKYRKKKRKEACDAIVEAVKKETGKTIQPNETDKVKYLLWEEQGHKCIYTGEEINVADFVGSNPSYDIEHTIPQSVGGDSTMMNLTLCNSRFNRDVKRAMIPHALSNYDDIIARISPWKEKVEELTAKIDKMRTNSSMAKQQRDSIIQRRHVLKLERDYWAGKYNRFLMETVPEGFSLRQGIGIGLISKYAGLYLKSLFHKPDDRNKSNVRVIKGAITAEFRRIWGLQSDYDRKSRDNHVHHCIDAIVIACMGTGEYSRMAEYYRDEERYRYGQSEKPHFEKPWATFTEDILNLESELLVVHSTPNNFSKKAKKKITVNDKTVWAQGDSVRGSLHKEKFYGAIEQDGKQKYVIRTSLSELKESDVNNIVDDVVRDKVKKAIEAKGFKEAVSGTIYMNKDKDILIKKVRIFVPSVTNPLEIKEHRDKSRHEYKRKYYTAVEENYAMALYEGVVNGNMKREKIVINNFEAAKYFKKRNNGDLTAANSILPTMMNGIMFRTLLKKGTQVVLLQNANEKLDLSDMAEIKKRFYYITKINTDGRITLRHHQEARLEKELKSSTRAGAYKDSDDFRPLVRLKLDDFHALIDGVDFKLNILGDVVSLR